MGATPTDLGDQGCPTGQQSSAGRREVGISGSVQPFLLRFDDDTGFIAGSRHPEELTRAAVEVARCKPSSSGCCACATLISPGQDLWHNTTAVVIRIGSQCGAQACLPPDSAAGGQPNRLATAINLDLAVFCLSDA